MNLKESPIFTGGVKARQFGVHCIIRAEVGHVDHGDLGSGGGDRGVVEEIGADVSMWNFGDGVFG